MTQHSQTCFQTQLRERMAADAAEYRRRMLKLERETGPFIVLPNGREFYSHRFHELVVKLLRADLPQTTAEMLEQMHGGVHSNVTEALKYLEKRGKARRAGTRKAPQDSATQVLWVAVDA